MKSGIEHLAGLGASAWRPRPHVRGGRCRVAAAIGNSLCSAVLEGIGFGLPLLSLLLGGEEATPMRPVRWLQTWFPGHKPAGYWRSQLLCFRLS